MVIETRANVHTCEQCGIEYQREPRKTGRYCSLRCSGLARRKSQPRTCLVCQASFRPHPSNPGKYCSTACHAASKRKPAVARRCALPTCGKSFEVAQADARRGGGKYCSRPCWIASRALPRGGRQVAVCRTCGQGREYYISELKRGRGAFCSRPCWARRQQERRAVLACEACGKGFHRPPCQGASRFCSRRCYDRSRKPKSFRCPICRTRAEFRTWRRPKFCSLACAYQGRGHSRDPEVLERNRRILELRAQGLKAPAIQAALKSERDSWWISPAAIRQVICRDQELVLAR